MDQEQFERDERKKRLVEARKAAGFASGMKAARQFGWNENSYKAHEAGRNGFSTAASEEYADAFGVSRQWLYLGIGDPSDQTAPTSRRVPLLSTVSAGALMKDDVADEAIGSVMVAGLGEGDWIALEVDGDSMDRISPPQSQIIINRRDKRLVNNACYIIADEDGSATYKRYRPNPMRFEPVSTNPIHETIFPDNEPTIIGRIKISMLHM